MQTYFPENERFIEIHFTNPEYAFISDDESSTSSSSSHRKSSQGEKPVAGNVTGCRNVDQLLLTHLYSCLPQFKYLDFQSPLERKKNKALEKLAFHGLVFEKILKYLKVRSKATLANDAQLLAMIPELSQSEQLLLFWNVLEKSSPVRRLLWFAGEILWQTDSSTVRSDGKFILPVIIGQKVFRKESKIAS